MVIGINLRNAIREDTKNSLTPTWGGGDPESDWRKAAYKGGSEVLSANRNLLVFVEGLAQGTDMESIMSFPLSLNIPNRLVYRFHLDKKLAKPSMLEKYSTFEQIMDQ